jgi:hypothetical protein
MDEMLLDTLNDKDIVNFYRTEYHKEWYNAVKNGINLTAYDIRMRLNLK